MLSKDDLLKLKTRKDIYNLILKNPGLHLREILRRTNLPAGNVQYHLKYLEKFGLIVSNDDLKYNRYYVKEKVDRRDKEILNLLRQKIPRRIILMLLMPGPGQIFKDNKTKKEAFKNSSTFLKLYSKKEIIELTEHWKGSYDKDFFVNKHHTTVIFHLQKLLDAGLIKKVKVGREYKYKLKDEDFIWEIFIKYNDALSINSINTMLSWQSDGIDWALENILDIGWEIFPHPYHV